MVGGGGGGGKHFPNKPPPNPPPPPPPPKLFPNNPPPNPFPFLHLSRRLSKKLLKTQPNCFFIACFPAGPLAVIHQLFTTGDSEETGRLINGEKLIFREYASCDSRQELVQNNFQERLRFLTLVYPSFLCRENQVHCCFVIDLVPERQFVSVLQSWFCFRTD